MSHHIKPTDGFFIAWGSTPTTCHYGPTVAGGQVHTGQPNFEFFDTEAELQAKVEELGFTYVSEDIDIDINP